MSTTLDLVLIYSCVALGQLASLPTFHRPPVPLVQLSLEHGPNRPPANPLGHLPGWVVTWQHHNFLRFQCLPVLGTRELRFGPPAHRQLRL